MFPAFRSSGHAARRDSASRWARAWAFVLVTGLSAVTVLTGCANGPAALAHGEGTAASDTITLFPLGDYVQDVDHWIDPAAPNYDTPFLAPEVQRAQFDALYARYFGTAADDPSPWNRAYIDSYVYSDGGSDIAALQERRLDQYDNADKPRSRIGYGMNFRPHSKAWIDAIARNVDPGQFERVPGYDPSRRAIATSALLVRELPTFDPSFYDHRIAGEGYPFDALQVSAVRPGTPVYVLGASADRGWRYVQTPDVQGWVRSDGVARVDDAFVAAWRAAFRKMPGVVVAASVPVRDNSGVFRFDAPAGTLLPLRPTTSADAHDVIVPVREVDGHAAMRTATLATTGIVPAPLDATPRHLAWLLKALVGRPYGWGNANFDNDCSAELQGIFAAFGVWLPRHSSTQMSAGDMIDLSALTPAGRLDYLVRHGQPMRTLIYIGGHVMLYLGNADLDGHAVPLVYQDIWGLRTSDNSRRAVIGGSVFLPLLLRYPEDTSLESLAATPTFQISILGIPKTGVPAHEDNGNQAG